MPSRPSAVVVGTPPRKRGRPPVAHPLSPVYTRLPPDLHDKVCRVALRYGVSVSCAARFLIVRALREPE